MCECRRETQHACVLFPKNGLGEKNRPKVGRGIKNAAKATKKPAHMIFPFVKSLEKREREEEREKIPLSVALQQDHSSSAYSSHREIDSRHKGASLQADPVEFLLFSANTSSRVKKKRTYFARLSWRIYCEIDFRSHTRIISVYIRLRAIYSRWNLERELSSPASETLR